jgi:hypothetical protein
MKYLLVDSARITLNYKQLLGEVEQQKGGGGGGVLWLRRSGGQRESA